MFRPNSEGVALAAERLSDVLPSIFLGRDGLVLTLNGYFDESLRSEERNEPICVAGYLFKPAAYVKFERQWHRTVLRHGSRRFTHFHMTDLCAGRQEYEGLLIPDRVEILNHAVDAVAAHSYAAVAIQFNQYEFEKCVPADWPVYYGSIYSSACQLCLQVTGFWLGRWNCPMRVLYVFERGHKFEDEAHRLMKGIARNEDCQKRFRYHQHIFEKKTSAVGLQAADLLAWTLTKAAIIDGGKVPPAFKPFIPSIFRLARINPERTKMYPLTGKRLARCLLEQSDPDSEPTAIVHMGRKRGGLR